MSGTASPATATSDPHSGHPTASFATLAIGSIGVVFGDIGTSPLYAFREALTQTGADGIDAGEIMGVVSLAFWALMIVVTIKYVLFLMRADNEGEGGVIALLALAGRAIGGRKGIVFVLGAAGAALFYGDAIITPALSVLSAVEGMKTLPTVAPYIDQERILGIAIVILVGLFAIQSRGTAKVARLFGPICALWFVAIGGLGLWHISDAPQVLLALLPSHAVSLLWTHGLVGLFVLGAVFLTVTGAEALTADMGHFGRVPIQAMWFALVFPALTLNYFGQAAFALSTRAHALAAGQPFANQDWFFLMAPHALRAPLVILATLATIIASQAVITGAFSLTQQAIRLGLLPRLKIEQTSSSHAGQIYVPVVNWLVLLGVMILILAFKTSSSMAAAYGIAVTGTMVITTCLSFVIVRKAWQWRLATALALIAPLLTIDVIFFGANILRVVEGGWVPLLVAAGVGLIINIWVRGRAVITAHEQDGAMPLELLVSSLARRPRNIVSGTAVFLTGNPDIAPNALLHNLKHNHVQHARSLITTIRTVSVPHVDPANRMTIEPIDEHFAKVSLSYGFMDMPDVPADIRPALDQLPHDKSDTAPSFFIGRNVLRASAEVGLPLWQDAIMMFLQRNASDPTDFFQIPPNRVVELGTQVTI